MMFEQIDELTTRKHNAAHLLDRRHKDKDAFWHCWNIGGSSLPIPEINLIKIPLPI